MTCVKLISCRVFSLTPNKHLCLQSIRHEISLPYLRKLRRTSRIHPTSIMAPSSSERGVVLTLLPTLVLHRSRSCAQHRATEALSPAQAHSCVLDTVESINTCVLDTLEPNDTLVRFVCVCVCVRARERKKERERELTLANNTH